MNIDVAAVFGALNSLATVVIPLFALLGVLTGVVMIGQAGKLLVWGRPGGGSESPPLGAVAVKLLIAACLMQLGTSIDWTRNGLMAGAGSGTRDAMTLVTATPAPIWTLIVSTGLLWLAAIGVAGVYRGFLLFAKAGSGDSQGGQGGDFFWRGLWHILGGAICINIGI